MKINMRVRIKNPYFWLGLIGTILAAVNVSPEMLTSWAAVRDTIVSVLCNPFQIGCIVIAIVGVFVDPTTAGIGDSPRALSYDSPSKE